MIEQLVSDEALELLQSIEKGYCPSSQEYEALSEIHELDLSDRQLQNLPKNIGFLTGLTSIDLRNNKLKEIPESIGSLPCLTKLDLGGNQLMNLPNWICNCKELTSLGLSYNQLSYLPESIGNLTRLTELFLGGNHLNNLPNSMKYLTNLSILNLSSNELTHCPEYFSCFKKLNSLNLSFNNVTYLPKSIGQLKQLTYLNLKNNKVDSLPDSIGQLTALKKLILSNNELNSLPDSFGNLLKLSYLSLNHNPLSRLPHGMKNLLRIRQLGLCDLRLDELPVFLLKLNIPFFRDSKAYSQNNGSGILIVNTTLSLQPVSLFDQSMDKSKSRSSSRKLIEDYFYAKHIPLRESKVILLGDAGAGKTYTVQRLLNDCKKTIKGEDGKEKYYHTESTHGILIEDLHCQREGQDYTVRIWDFGGQDIMNEMHRCFLTERTCYIILVDTRNNGQTHRARRWLRTVRNVAPNAPVLLLVNEHNGGVNLDLDAASLRQEFPDLWDVRHCSARDAGQQTFRENVEQPILDLALGMDGCKMTLPESWEQVRKELLSMRENNYCIDRNEFHHLCDEHGVPKDGQLRVWLLNWFNDMGVCFSYHFEGGEERNTDYKILEPKWLTSAIYRLIWEKEQTEDGIITRKEIELILSQKGSARQKEQGIPCLDGVSYTSKQCGYVLEIMRKYALSYPADENREFMPTLCKPDSKLDPAPAEYEQRVSVQFRYDLLPEKMIHELMIYCYNSLRPGKMWRKGFWVENPVEGLCAVLYTPSEQGREDTLQMDVYTLNEYHTVSEWLQPLCKEIRGLNQRLKLKAEPWVLARGKGEEKWFRLETVWYWRTQAMEQLMGERTLFPIRPLLELVYGNWLTAAENDHDISWQKQDNPDRERKESEVDRTTPELKEVLKQNTEALRENTTAIKRNTSEAAVNSAALSANTAALQQSTALLELIRDGKYPPPPALMDELNRIIQENEQLRLAFEASQEETWLGQFRDLLGDSANCMTIGATLAKSLPVLMKLIPTLASLLI